MSRAPNGGPPMPHTTPDPPGLALVRLVAAVVPRRRRPEFLAEWAGELEWARREGPQRREHPVVTHLRLHLRSLGALSDALWLRRRHGAAPMLSLDVRYAVRTLARRPGFASIVVLTLALGIGATTAIFSVVHGVLLRPLDLPEPERLVALRNYPTDGNVEKVGPALSYPDFAEFRSRAPSFRELAAGRTAPATLTTPGAEPSRIVTGIVTPNYFTALGLRPVLGRAFGPADAAPDAPAVAVLHHDLWQTRFGGDPTIVGRTIAIDGDPVTVVGVLPPDLGVATSQRLFRPLVPEGLDQVRGVHRLYAIGRLAPGATVERARAEVAAVAAALEQQYPEDNTRRGAELLPLQETIVGDVRPALLVLLGAVTMVLLVGCANLASLFLARAAAREREMAVRAALGAGRGRLVRQWLTESVLLTATGAVAGVGVAWVATRALLAAAPDSIPRADEVGLDTTVLLFLLGVSVLVAVAFGLVPAWQRRRADDTWATLRDGARGATPGHGRRRARHLLVVGEVALATMLVCGAGALLQSFWRLSSADLGFQPQGLVVAQVQLPATRYDSVAKIVRFYDQLREQLATLPGAPHAALAMEHPLSEGWTSSYGLADREPPPQGQEPEARVRPVWPGYFRTVGVPIVAGRDVTEQDRMGAPAVVVVNEAFVRRHYPGESAIGKRLLRGAAWWPGQPTDFEIVGVVADEPFLGPNVPADPATYFSHAQFPMNDMWIVVRGDGDAARLAPALRERLWRLDPTLPLEQVRAMPDLVGAAVAAPRFNALLLSLFAAAALLLAAIGIYGVLAYTVAQRTAEIGVRMALGAERGRVVRQVVGQGLVVALAGVALGLAGAIGSGRLLSATLEGMRTADPRLLATVAALLTLVAVLAAWLPARRASRIDPMVALRE